MLRILANGLTHQAITFNQLGIPQHQNNPTAKAFLTGHNAFDSYARLQKQHPFVNLDFQYAPQKNYSSKGALAGLYGFTQNLILNCSNGSSNASYTFEDYLAYREKRDQDSSFSATVTDTASTLLKATRDSQEGALSNELSFLNQTHKAGKSVYARAGQEYLFKIKDTNNDNTVDKAEEMTFQRLVGGLFPSLPIAILMTSAPLKTKFKLLVEFMKTTVLFKKATDSEFKKDTVVSFGELSVANIFAQRVAASEQNILESQQSLSHALKLEERQCIFDAYSIALQLIRETEPIDKTISEVDALFQKSV